MSNKKYRINLSGNVFSDDIEASEIVGKIKINGEIESDTEIESSNNIITNDHVKLNNYNVEIIPDNFNKLSNDVSGQNKPIQNQQSQKQIEPKPQSFVAINMPQTNNLPKEKSYNPSYVAIAVPDIENQISPVKVQDYQKIPLDQMDKKIYKMDPQINKIFTSVDEEEASRLFEELKYKKQLLENSTFIIDNIDNIKNHVIEFKRLYNEFNNKFLTVPSKYKSELIELNNSIDLMVEKQKQLQILEQAYGEFNETIKEYKVNEIFGSIIKNLNMFGLKTSASMSEILRGTYNGSPVYIKMFGQKTIHNSSSGLEYEQRIYRYIKDRQALLNPDPKLLVSPIFVPVYDVFKIRKYDFYNLIDSKLKIKDGIHNDKFYYSTTINDDTKVLYTNVPPPIISTNDYVYFIVTGDTSSQEYHHFFLNNIDNKNNIISTLFDIFYAIYLLNEKFKINHNDIHFSNILIKNNIHRKNYYIDSIFMSREVNWEVLIYDFDGAYFDGIINNKLFDNNFINVGKSNNFNLTRDVWTILNSFWSTINYEIKILTKKMNETRDAVIAQKINSTIRKLKVHYMNVTVSKLIPAISKNYLFDLVYRIILQTPEQIETYEHNIIESNTKKIYWNIFCEKSINQVCNQPNWPDQSAQNVLKRFLKNPDYIPILGFDQMDAFNKKYERLYLKYKQKYLNLKNKINKTG